MNWGNKILIVLILFVSGIGYMVYTCVKQKDIELVTKSYYEEEIKYQNVIDKENNYRSLPIKPTIQSEVDNMVVVDFSELDTHNNIRGSIYFFRPSQSELDFKKEIHLDNTGKQLIDNSSIKKGKWLVKMDWTDGEKDYYNEQTIFIQ